MDRKQREKEKLLVTSNFSFTHSVFKRLLSQGRQKVSLSGKGLSQVSIRLKTKEAVVFSRMASGQPYIIQNIYPIKL